MKVGRKPFPVPSDLAGVLAWHKRQVETARERAARYALPEIHTKATRCASWRAHQVHIAECQQRLHGACVAVLERELAAPVVRLFNGEVVGDWFPLGTLYRMIEQGKT